MDVEATNEHNFDCKAVLTSLMNSCRVCMALGLNMSCIFDTEKENIIHEIQFCTGVTIKQEAGLPSLICESCLQNLSVAYKFKTSCLIADETFHKLVVAPSIKAEEPELSNIEYEYEGIEYKDDETADEFDEDIKIEIQREPENEIELEPNGVRKSACVKVKERPAAVTPVPSPPDSSLSSASPSPEPRSPDWSPDDASSSSEEYVSPPTSPTPARRQGRGKPEQGMPTGICEICGKIFNNRESQYRHVKWHQPPKYWCDQCDYKTSHKPALIYHIRTHTGGVKSYQCEQCTASFYNSFNLTEHIRRMHTKERPHGCTTCQMKFFNKSALNRHLDTHLKIKRFKCDICQGHFASRCWLKKHLLRLHDIVTPRLRPGRQKISSTLP